MKLPPLFTWRSRLSYRVVSAFVLVALLPVTAIAVFGARNTKHLLGQEVKARQSDTTEIVAQQLGDFLATSRQELEELGHIWYTLSPDLKQINSLLQRMTQEDALYTAMWIMDSTGQEVTHVVQGQPTPDSGLQNQAEREFFFRAVRLSEGEAYYSAVRFTDEAPQLITSLPIFNDGTLLGVIAAQLNISGPWNIIANAGIGEHGYAYLLDRRGTLIIHQDASLASRSLNFSNIPPIRAMFTGDTTQSVYEYTSPLGPDVLGSAYRIDGTDWLLVLERPAAEAFAVYDQARNALLSISVMAALVALALGIMSSRRITRPILLLTRQARQIQAGDLSVRADVRTRDEISELAHAFNAMTAQLRQTLQGLQQRITEREQAEAALRESEARYRSLFEDSPISLWEEDFSASKQYIDGVKANGVVDLAAHFARHPEDVKQCARLVKILDVNQATVELYHAAGKQDFYTGLANVLGDGALDTFQEELLALAAGATHYETEIDQRTLASETLRVSLSLSIAPGYEESWAKVFVSIIDITERKEAEQKLHDRTKQISLLYDASHQLSHTLDLDIVLDTLLDLLARVVPYDSASILLLDSDTRVSVRAAHSFGQWGDPEKIRQYTFDAHQNPFLRVMLDTYKSIRLPDTLDQPGWERRPGSEHIRSWIAVPLIASGNMVGLYSIAKAEPGFFTEEHVQIAEALATQGALAVQNAQLYAEIRQHAARLEHRVVERTAELETSEARYRAIVEDQTELVCRHLPDHTLTFVNRAYCRYFGKTREELIGQSFMQYVDKADQAQVEETLARLTPENPVTTIEHRFVAPNGKIHWQQWIDRLIVDEHGHATEIQGVGRDITERKLAEEVLQKSLAREIELGELKSRFISMVSHEFRTPLAIISMNSDILQKYRHVLSPEQQDEQFNNIFEAIRRMIELLDDVLTISRTESGRLEFAPSVFDAAELCQTVIDDVQTTLGAALTFRLNAVGACSEVVLDKKLVHLILSNLISNAARYTPAGRHVTIELECETTEVTFRVQDEGLGIPQADQPRIFEPFYRAENVETITGTGLGLAIAQQCVEQHGGTITFESKVNAGTTFTVRLPVMPRPHLVSGEN